MLQEYATSPVHLALALSLLTAGCAVGVERDGSAVSAEHSENSLSQASGLRVVKTWRNEHIGTFVIRQPGIYRINGTVTGNIDVNLSTRGQVVLEGVAGTKPTIQGIPRPGQRRHVSHVSGSIDAGSSVIARNFELKNNAHNGLEFGGPGHKLVQNVVFTNHTRTIDGKTVFGAGCINAGENSEIRGADLHTGDDAIKITEANSTAHDSRVTMYENGSAIQFGWGNRADGNTHVAQNVEVFGSIKTNVNHDAPNEDDNSGRAVIGGVFQNDVSDVRITGLRVHGTDYARVIKLVADGATLRDVTIEGDLLDGLENHRDGKGRTWYAIVLVAKNGGKIQNMVIDLGDRAADPKYHFIKGNVDVTFVKKQRPVPDAEPGAIGASCTDDYDCETLTCNSAKQQCRAKKMSGSPCSIDGNCRSGVCNGGICR